MTACPTLPSLNEANLLILHRKVLAKLLEEDKDLLAEIDTSAVLDILNRLPLRSLPEFLYKYFVSIVSRVSVDFAVIFKILVECPEVSKRNDIRKMFPLHFIMTLPFDQPACRALLGLLLKQNPSVLCEKNEEGDTPLHVYLTQNSPDPAVIAAILSAAPRAARLTTCIYRVLCT